MHRNPFQTQHTPRISRQDRVVQATDIDALSSKYSAYTKGYLRDPFLQAVVDGARTPRTPFTAKLPVINIGSYVRHYAIDAVVARTLAAVPGRCQIVSLGAGSDTRPFNIFAEYGQDRVVYHEIDFAVSTAKKVKTIVNTPEIWELVRGPSSTTDPTNPAELHTPHYHLHALDLREIRADTPLLPGMDPTLPTLILSECCLCYLQPDHSETVLRWLAARLPHGRAVALYEPVRGDDAFGRVMIENLAARGLALPTLQRFPSLGAQAARLADAGFADAGGMAGAADVWSIYEEWVPAAERERMAKLEVLDEVEELELLLKHYCVAWAVSDESPDSEWVKAFKELPSDV